MPHDPEYQLVGRCACGSHHLTIEVDTDPSIAPKHRTVDLLWWEYGHQSHWGWRRRLRYAWAWLRGNPQPMDALLLTRQETDQLIEALQAGRDRAWGEEPYPTRNP